MKEALRFSRVWCFKPLVLLTALLFVSLGAWAQTRTSGAIVGTVQDPSGAVVPNATVTATEITTGVVRNTRTTSSGNYNLAELDPGNYRLKVDAPGFQTSLLGPFRVAVSVVVTINVSMKVGEATQTVTVTEAAPVIAVQNPNTTTSLTATQIANLPNPGQDLSYVANVAPGAVMNSTGGYGNTEFNGLPSTSNNFTQDGIPANDPFLNLNNTGATNLQLGLNAVQEISVNTNSFDAQQGGLGAMQENVISKRGGNQFHGNVYEIWNGAKFNSADYFVNAIPGSTKPGSNVNEFGGSIGGPIKKDKAFFFTDIEGNRIALPVFNSVTVPSAAFRSLILTQSLPNGGADPIFGGNLPAQPSEIPLYNTMFSLYGTPRGSAQPQLGCPLGSGATGAVPNGDGCLLRTSTSVGSDTHDFLWTSRVDQTLNDTNTIWYRFQYEKGVQATYTDPLSPLYNAFSTQPQVSGSIGYTHTFSPNVVNELDPGMQWYSAIFTNQQLAKSVALFPVVYDAGAGAGLNRIGGANYAWPQGRNVTSYFVNDNLSWTKGKNEFKFGELFHRYLVSDHDFAGNTTPYMGAYDLPEFMFGATGFTVQAFTASQDQPIGLAGMDLYASDAMKLKSNLTLTLGIRATWNSNFINQHGLFSRLDGAFYNITHDLNTPLNAIINPREAYGIQQTPLIMWQPRAALAYQFAKDTVFRGGFGVFTDIFPASLSDQLGSNFPNYNSFNYGVLSGAGGAGFAPGSTQSAYDLAVAANQALLNGFSSGVLSCAATNAPANCIAPAGFVATPRYVTYPYSIQWNIGIEHQFGPSWGMNVYYVGDRYVQEPYFVHLNSFNTFCAGCFAPYPFKAPADARFGDVQQVAVGASSNYNALQVTGRKVMSHGLMFQLSYAYSHCLDEISNGGFFGFSGISQTDPIPGELGRNYGNCDYDVRHSLNGNYVWQLPSPVHSGVLRWVVNGWQVSGDIFIHGGFPVTMLSSSCGSAITPNVGTCFASTVPGVTALGQYAHGPIPGVTQVGQVQFLNPNAFQSVIDPSTGACVGGNTVANCQLGNIARNSVFGPGFFWTDMFVSKYFNLGERVKLRIDGQFYNLFNHPNFAFPGNTAGVPSDPATLTGVGTITSLVSPPTGLLGSFLGGDNAVRMIAFQARLEF